MFYWLARAVIGPLMRLVYRPWSVGTENIPSKGPAILAGNHLAVIDSFFLPILIPRRVFFIAKSDYFTGRGLKGRLVGGFMRGIGMIPVDRAGGRAAVASLDQGRKMLDKGHLFGIYPEGTRSPDGRLYRGKTGVARLAIESGAPVIPVAMIGTDIAQPAGKRIPKMVRVGLVVGQPLDFSRYAGRQDDRFVLRAVTDEIMYRLMELSGQSYVDVYAATMKARLAAGKSDGVAAPATGAPGGRPRPKDLVPPTPPDTTPAGQSGIDQEE